MPPDAPHRSSVSRLPARRIFAAAAFVSLALALVPPAGADHVTPQAVAATADPACDDFDGQDTDWQQLQVQPPLDGNYSSADDELNVTVDVNPQIKRFDWSSNIPVGYVIVKGSTAGHHIYAYAANATNDTALRTPGTGNTNPISAIRFCYLVPAPTCEEEPTMPGCEVDCEEQPEHPDCQIDCEEQPEHPDCQIDCEEQPEHPDCQIDCEEQPEHPDCQPQPCSATVEALANEDGSVTVTVQANGSFELQRRTGDGNFTSLGTFENDTVYEDNTTVAGTTYTYRVVVGREACDEATVTAIPVFPNLAGVVAAAGLGLLGYALVRRRR